MDGDRIRRLISWGTGVWEPPVLPDRPRENNPRRPTTPSRTVGGTTQTYTYSGDGARLTAATGSQASNTAHFTVDRAFALPTVVAERDGSGKLIRRYTYGLALLAADIATLIG